MPNIGRNGVGSMKSKVVGHVPSRVEPPHVSTLGWLPGLTLPHCIHCRPHKERPRD